MDISIDQRTLLVAGLDKALGTGEQLLSARLGSLVKAIAPDINYKSFGGLRTFVERNLADVLFLDGYSGGISGSGDLLYTWRASGGANKAKTWLVVTSDEGKPDFWSDYTNPSIPATFALSPETNILKYHEGNVEIEVDWLDFKKITTDDYKQMMQDYIANYATELHGTVESIFDQPDFYSAWIKILKQHSKQNALPEWEEFRVKSILHQFLTKLLEFHVPDAVAKSMQMVLDESRNISSQRTSLGISSHAVPHGAGEATSAPLIKPHNWSAPQIKDEQLRKIAKLVIDALPTDNLQKLEIPLGIAIKAALQVIKESK